MKEYQDFTFSQSQASVYRIIEQNAPYMISEIKQRIHEGRWELSASAWVECDKNMPNGESLSRHILYTKRYLSNSLRLSLILSAWTLSPIPSGTTSMYPKSCKMGA
jgi:alpha-mannosidase